MKYSSPLYFLEGKNHEKINIINVFINWSIDICK